MIWEVHGPDRWGTVSVVQISRGMAPAQSVAIIASFAADRSCPYSLVTGLTCAEAKNAAVEIADEEGNGLLLVEDDICTANLAALFAPQDGNRVRILSATCRNGDHNTIYDSNGQVLYSGTVAVYIPRAVLDQLPRPVFEAVDYTRIDDELAPISKNGIGHHSDVHLYVQLRKLGVPVDVVGHATTFAHPLNSGAHDLTTTCELVEVA